jgi:hypothetical protein
VRLLRADLHAELGEDAEARSLYGFVRDTGYDAAAAQAADRIASLDAGSVPTADIKALRVASGAQCAMCHGTSGRPPRLAQPVPTGNPP